MELMRSLNNCITLLKEGWALGAQEDRTASYITQLLFVLGNLKLDSAMVPGPLAVIIRMLVKA